MSKALTWKLPKKVLPGDEPGRKPIEQSPVVANHVLSSTMNNGESHPYPYPQPQPDQPAGQKPLLANAGTTSAQQPALAPLPAQNISGANRKAQQTRRRRNRKFSTVAEMNGDVAVPDYQMELEGSDDQVITKDDFVQGFMKLRPRIKGQNGSTSHVLNVDDHKNGFIDFSLSLSKKEIEEDFLAMTGQKPRQRPTLKRPHAVQKRINKMFPGLDLDLVCPQAYAVEEKETAGKRI